MMVKRQRVKLYRDCNKRQIVFHILPGLSVFLNKVDGGIQFSWLIWTLEIVFLGSRISVRC